MHDLLIGLMIFAAMLLAVIGMTVFFTFKCLKWVSRVEAAADFIDTENELLNELLDWFEEKEKFSKPLELVKTEIVKPEKPEQKRDLMPNDEEFWNDLPALENELAEIENGASAYLSDDPLDHIRRVSEAIADIKDKNTAPRL